MCRVVSKGTEVTLDTVSNMLISTYIVKHLPCDDQIPREILPENEWLVEMQSELVAMVGSSRN
jgi:hypothetical protein